MEHLLNAVSVLCPLFFRSLHEPARNTNARNRGRAGLPPGRRGAQGTEVRGEG